MRAVRPNRSGGAGRDRTGDLLNANQALSQLSYSPGKPNRLLMRAAQFANCIEADWTHRQWSLRLADKTLPHPNTTSVGDRSKSNSSSGDPENEC
jgi:hypothetical protein